MDLEYDSQQISLLLLTSLVEYVTYFFIQTNRRKHRPPTLGSYTGLTLPDKNATKMQTKRPINKLEKADILIIIWKHIQPISSQIMGNNQAQNN